MNDTTLVEVQWPLWECIRCGRHVRASWATLAPDGTVHSSGLASETATDLSRSCGLTGMRACLCAICRAKIEGLR